MKTDGRGTIVCQACLAEFSSNFDFNQHAAICPATPPILKGESWEDYKKRSTIFALEWVVRTTYDARDPDTDDDYVQCPGCCHTVIPDEPGMHCNDKGCSFCDAPCKLAVQTKGD